MADQQELNKLNVRSVSLPDNWLVTLVNPVTGAVAENMTVARFVELFTSKQPEATNAAKGVITPAIYNTLYSKEKTYRTVQGIFAAYKIKTSIKVTEYNSLYFYCRVGQSQNAISNQIISFNVRLWEYRFTSGAAISLGSGDVKDIVIYEENDGYITAIINFKRSLNLSGGAIDLLFRSYDGVNSVVSIEGMNENYVTGSHSNEIVSIIPSTSSYLLNKNDLTMPVLDSYSSTPPPANCVPNCSKSASSVEQFANPAVLDIDSPDGSTPVKFELSESTGEKHAWSIDKIGKAVLELQNENKQLKQILADNGIEVQIK